MSNEIGRLLAWDTDFFGRVVARVEGDRLRGGDVPRLLSWCRARDVEFLYLLTDAGDLTTLRSALAAGFELMDVRLEMETSLEIGRPEVGGLPAGLTLREALVEDKAALEVIAADVHTDSRFFVDERVPRDRAQALFATWIARSIDHDLADVVLVVDRAGTASGYITARRDGEDRASIGLLGVGAGLRGQGVAGALIRTLLDRLRLEGVSVVTVVTQGRNVAAQRAYQRSGFLTKSVKFWLHKWMT